MNETTTFVNYQRIKYLFANNDARNNAHLTEESTSRRQLLEVYRKTRKLTTLQEH